MDEFADITIGPGEPSVLAFFSALLNQLKFCVDVYEARPAIESIAVEVRFTPGFCEEKGLSEEVCHFVLDEDLLD